MTPEVWGAALAEAIEYEQLAEDARRRALLACAQMHYDDAKPLRGGHPYLDRLGLDMAGCEDLRVDRDGQLVVPAWKAGELASVLVLWTDGLEEWWPGLSIGGAAYEIRRPTASVTVLCEGFADGLACFRALKTCRVVVCFNERNLRRYTRPAGLVAVVAAPVAAPRWAEIQDRMGKRYNGRPTANEIERNVDAGIADMLMRAARFTGLAEAGPRA